jgi:hypothetical protein
MTQPLRTGLLEDDGGVVGAVADRLWAGSLERDGCDADQPFQLALDSTHVTLNPARKGQRSRWTTTPPPTRLTPATSTHEGTWASTTIPTTVAVAGNSETMSA